MKLLIIDAFTDRPFAGKSKFDRFLIVESEHCCLGPFWSERLAKTELTAFQASARGGVVRVRVNGDRVIRAGQAVTVVRGELL